MSDSLAPYVRIQGHLYFFSQQGHGGTLASVTAAETKQLLEQLRIPLASAIPLTQVMHDDALDNRFVQLVGEFRPFDIS